MTPEFRVLLGEQAIVRDLWSENGYYVEIAPLRSGDELLLDEHIVKVHGEYLEAVDPYETR